jgi:hypothetical protein
MVSFNPSTSLRSGSSLSDFRALQVVARKEFDLQSVIFRDNLQTAHDVIAVLRDLTERGYDLSGISINVSKEATKKYSRWILGMKKGDTPEIINENFQALKHLLPANLQETTQTDLQKQLLETSMTGGHSLPTVVGTVQKPLLIVNPNYKQVPLTTASTDDPLHTIYHELGHILHIKNIFNSPPLDKNVRGIERRSTLNGLYVNLETFAFKPYMESLEDLGPLIELMTKIVAKVSQYAGTRLLEFVPEHCVKKWLDPSYNDEELEQLYKTLKGPEILPKPSKP